MIYFWLKTDQFKQFAKSAALKCHEQDKLLPLFVPITYNFHDEVRVQQRLSFPNLTKGF